MRGVMGLIESVQSEGGQAQNLVAAFPSGARVALVTDSNVDALHGDRVVKQLETGGLVVERIVVPAGEKTKNLESYARLVRAFAQLGFTRSDFVCALGGGVVGDLAGFAAATYMRGIEIVHVPTTLLAMVDSSLGGKTAVDIPEGKNLVGAFHLPRAIVRDVNFLSTLPEQEMRNGLAEMIKTAILFDPEMFEALLHQDDPKNWVERCARWKQKIVDEDFREKGTRKLLNLGHTFGHAIEKVSDFKIAHGTAVAIGLRVVGREIQKIGEILDVYHYPRYEGFDDAAILKAITADKKRAGDSVTLVVPKRIGCCALVETPLSELAKWLS